MLRLLAMLTMGILASDRARAQDSMSACPDLTGEYQIVGPAAPLFDALQVTALSGASAAGYRIELQSPSGSRIVVRTTYDGPSALPTRVAAIWTFGEDFTCKGGQLVFGKRHFRARRTIADVFYLGESTVRIGKGGNHGLHVVVEFKGNTTIGLPFQNVVQKPGPTKTFTDIVHWPPAPAPLLARNVPAGPSRLEVDVKKMWSKLVPEVVLGGVRVRGSAAIVSYSARSEKQAAAIEERLRAASIAYTTKTAPIWVGNGYFVELELTHGAPR